MFLSSRGGGSERGRGTASRGIRSSCGLSYDKTASTSRRVDALRLASSPQPSVSRPSRSGTDPGTARIRYEEVLQRYNQPATRFIGKPRKHQAGRRQRSGALRPPSPHECSADSITVNLRLHVDRLLLHSCVRPVVTQSYSHTSRVLGCAGLPGLLRGHQSARRSCSFTHRFLFRQ